MKFLGDKVFSFIIVVALIACNEDKKITKLLNSDKSQDLIIGAFKAGETGDKKFVPLLLKNANDQRSTTHINYQGITVYQAKMQALEDIFKQKPPVKITRNPDSLVIKFYTGLSNLEN